MIVILNLFWTILEMNLIQKKHKNTVFRTLLLVARKLQEVIQKAAGTVKANKKKCFVPSRSNLV